MNFLNARHSEN